MPDIDNPIPSFKEITASESLPPPTTKNITPNNPVDTRIQTLKSHINSLTSTEPLAVEITPLSPKLEPLSQKVNTLMKHEESSEEWDEVQLLMGEINDFDLFTKELSVADEYMSIDEEIVDPEFDQEMENIENILVGLADDIQNLDELEKKVETPQTQETPQAPTPEDVKPAEVSISPPRKNDVKTQTEQDKIFEEYSNLIQDLNKDKSLKLMQENPEAAITKQKRNQSFFKFLFRSGKSSQTQNALMTILTNLEKRIKEAAEQGDHNPTFVSKNGDKKLLKDLYKDYIQSRYGQNIIKNSPRIAEKIASPYLQELKALDLKEYEKLNKSLKTHTNTLSKILSPFVGEARLKFIQQLPLKLQQAKLKLMEKAPPPEPVQVRGDISAKTKNLISELVTTEKNFLANLEKLLHAKIGDKRNNFFDSLLDQQLIEKQEYQLMTSLWSKMIKEGTKNLQKLEQAPSDAEKIEVLQEIYSPQNIKAYYEAFLPTARHFQNLQAKLGDIGKTTEGRTLFNAFESATADANGIPGQGPLSIMIMPVQRLPRHEMLLTGIANALPKIEANSQLQSNFDQVISYTKASVQHFNLNIPLKK